MQKVLFVVDDHPVAVEAAKLILRDHGNNWKIVPFTNPIEALSAIKEHQPDLVLADQRMPQMLGSQFLEKVRSIAPGTIRIINSAHMDTTHLSAITSAHQYLTKPLDPKQLRQLVKNALSARDRMHTQGLLPVIAGLRYLPSLPHVYHTLLTQLQDPTIQITTVAQTIAKDQGISTKLLQLANSPMFGSGTVISTPAEAIMRLGIEVVKSVVISQETFRHYARIKTTTIDLPRLWSHCWQVAQNARFYSQTKHLPQDDTEFAFLAGLLHELGKLIILENFPDLFQTAADTAKNENRALNKVLHEQLKASPFEIGAYLLELWGIPEKAITAIVNIENPHKVKSDQFDVTAALYIADQISTRKSPPDPYPVPTWDGAYLKQIGCENDLIEWERLPTPTA